MSPRRPLDTVYSLKIKLGAVIFSAVAVTVFVFWLCLAITDEPVFVTS